MKANEKILYKNLKNEAISHSDDAEVKAVRNKVGGQLHPFDIDNMATSITGALEAIVNNPEFGSLHKDDLLFEPVRALLEHYLDPHYYYDSDFN